MNAQVYVHTDEEGRVQLLATTEGREVTVTLEALTALTLADDLTRCAEQINRRTR